MKQAVKKIINKLGFELKRLPVDVDFTIEGLTYGTIKPVSNYNPWNSDKLFLEVYNKIKNNTLVDIYRCYELWELIAQVHSVNPNIAILEVGVWQGGTAAIIAQKIKNLKSSSTLYLADTFTGVVKSSNKDKFYNDGEHSDTSQEIVESVLTNNIGFNTYKILKGVFPEETGNLIPENTLFNLCHVDVDVYQSAKDIVNWIWDKIVVGGVIVFDDYGSHSCTGITKYVDEQKTLDDRIILHNINGHAIMVKIR